MRSTIKNIDIIFTAKLVAPGVNEHYISSFTEFYPFCPALYYFSSFKDFKTMTQA